MTDIKLICLDMDGTLLGADHATVPVRNVRALRAASERGAAVGGGGAAVRFSRMEKWITLSWRGYPSSFPGFSQRFLLLEVL